MATFRFRAKRSGALFAQDDHALWNTVQEQARLLVSGADGAGAPALWRRQKEKLLPFMQEEKPKIGTGTAGVKLTVLDSPENKVRFAGLLRAFSVLRENRHVSDADFPTRGMPTAWCIITAWR